MDEIRFANAGDIKSQKAIWKHCFGDQDSYIDQYYSKKYRMEETLLLLKDGEISAMLTILPAKVVTPDNKSIASSILYAIATHPKHQNKGLASQLIDFTGHHLSLTNKSVSLLVPASKQLFEFYHKLGYTEAFYIREVLLSNAQILSIKIQDQCTCKIKPAIPQEYNQIRDNLLMGKLYVSYTDELTTYQKIISQESGADIYKIEHDDIQSCAVLERYTSDKVIIKELLCPDNHSDMIIKQLAHTFPAKEYILRTPAFSGERYGGRVRPFAMFKKHLDVGINSEIAFETLGYLGLAFD
ncbi:MAG: GNAT family N-acetyltransferase [Firmicutes bacterium HGW-Firmicutes-12]|jgi:ribosomal protein S18 acetylase RimI-like enzyme|nr:MAG: GNAT family N-acetyltransferase [Firmicutes bacterium HGW-Firmicutes-12]